VGGSAALVQASPLAPQELARFLSQVNAKNKVIRTNQANIRTLESQLNAQIREVKAKLNGLKENPASLEAKDVAQAKEVLEEVKASHQNLKATQGLISRKVQTLRTARQNGRPGLFLQTQDDIIRIQERRIEVLRRTISHLKRLNQHLN
jgi:chromosome segregation ATPase